MVHFVALVYQINVIMKLRMNLLLVAKAKEKSIVLRTIPVLTWTNVVILNGFALVDTGILASTALGVWMKDTKVVAMADVFQHLRVVIMKGQQLYPNGIYAMKVENGNIATAIIMPFVGVHP